MQNIGWSLGSYCNARCKHCYSWQARQGKLALTKEEIDLIIEKIKRADTKTVNFGGNEPIFTDGPAVEDSKLPYIVTRLHELGIVVGITTNGTTCLELYNRWPGVFNLVNDWDVSFDSPFEEEHNNNRGADLYNVALGALELCKEREKVHAIILCGMKWNLDRKHLDGFLELAKMYGAELRINTLKPTEKAHFRDFPSRKQYFRAFRYLMQRTDSVVVGESTLVGLTDKACVGCSCGTNSLRINSKTKEGTVPVSPCVYLHDFRTGDLLKDELSDIIASSCFRQLQNRNKCLPAKCAQDCKYARVCRGGCAARAYLIRESLEERDPYCPIEEKGLKQLVVNKADKVGIRVHENYLCTWIGKPRGFT